MITKKMMTRILRKRHQGFNFDEDMEKVLLSTTKEELNCLSYMLIFEDHIDDYVKDCLLELRKFKKSKGPILTGGKKDG